MQFRIFSFKELCSTNDEAGESRYTHGDIIVADYQSSGRGQRGNVWRSEGGENLLFSIVVEPEGLRASEAFILSQLTALSVAECLRDFGIESVEIKWPNDILIAGKKIAGILIENSLMSEYVGRSVIGVGLNVLQRDFSVVKELEATSMVNEGALGASVRGALERFCENFAKFYCEYTREELHAIYMCNLYRREGFWNFRDNILNENIEARIFAIDYLMGVMELELIGGEHRKYYFKEVSFL